jgi:hypothetical protein
MLDKYLNAPIPGQSLTNEPGNTPWEQPPQMVDLPEVVQYYTERLTDAEGVDAVVNLLENDVPCVEVAKTLMRFSVMKGVHTVDAGMIALPVIVELVKSIGDLNDIDYSVVSPGEKAPKPPSEAMVLELLNEAKETIESDVDSNPAAAPKKGLMARRKGEAK